MVQLRMGVFDQGIELPVEHFRVAAVKFAVQLFLHEAVHSGYSLGLAWGTLFQSCCSMICSTTFLHEALPSRDSLGTFELLVHLL